MFCDGFPAAKAPEHTSLAGRSTRVESAEGAAIRIRPIRPDDLDELGEFLSGLSEQARHHRWGARKLLPSELARLSRVDPERTVALVANECRDGQERIVGEARYVREADGRACEFALVVADRQHGRGLGEQLLRRLIEGARRAGIHRMYGTTLGTNAAMLGLARKLGFRIRMRLGDVGVVELSQALGRW